MAKFEKYCPQLKPGRITPQGSKLIFETDSPTDQIVLPIETVDFLLLCTGEYSVGEIIEQLYHRKGTIQFKKIYRTLIYLKERGFLENGEQLEIPQDNSPGRGIKFFSVQPFFEFNIGKRIFNETDRPVVFYFCSMLAIVAAAFSLQDLKGSAFSFPFFHINGSFWQGLLFLFVTSSILLSCKNVFKSLLLIFLTGRAYNFAFAFNGFSLYFRVRSDSLFLISNRFYLTLFHLAASLCFFPIVSAIYLLMPQLPHFNEMQSVAVLLFLFSINPFQESEASHWLRSLFNDDTLNKMSNYLPHRSLLSLVNPTDRTKDNNLYFFFTHFAIVWAAVMLFTGFLTLTTHHPILLTTFKSASIHERLAALLTCSLIISFAYAVISNTVRLFHLSLLLPISHAVLAYLRKRQSRRIDHYNQKEVMSTLEALPLFNYFNNDVLQTIIKQSVVKEYKQQSPVILQGDPGRHLFVLLSGTLQVRRRLSSGRVKLMGEIHPSSIFGEIAVIEDSPRAADVIALEKSIVLEVPASVIRKITEDSQYVRELTGFRNAIMVNQFFTAAPIFRDLAEHLIHLFIQKGKIESYTAEQVIFKQGDHGDGFYLLLRGTVGVSVNGRPVTRIQQGGFFGEISMIADVPRTATIYSIEHAQILKISRDAFWEILSHDINMAMLIESVGEMRVREDIEIIKAATVRVA
jgi:CRP-like cAMP-binding protein